MDLTNWWVQTHQAPSSAQQMWESWEAPHRKHMVDALLTLPELESVYEVGCGSGPNLRLIKEIYCHPLRLGGADPSPGMAAWASEHLGISVDVMALPQVPDTKWDCVMSCYAMAYLEPNDAEKTLDNLRKVAKYLVLFEPNAGIHPYDQPGMYSRGGALPEWAHDYPVMLRNTGWLTLWRWPYMPPKDGLNTMIVAEQDVE